MYNSNYNNYADNSANNANPSAQWQQQQPYGYNQGQPGSYGAPPVGPAPAAYQQPSPQYGNQYQYNSQHAPGMMSPPSTQPMPNTYASSPAPYPAYGQPQQPPVIGHGQPGSYGSPLPPHHTGPAFEAQPQYQSPAAYIPPASVQPGAYNAPPPPGQGVPPQGKLANHLKSLLN
jgi:hypothetical protein